MMSLQRYVVFLMLGATFFVPTAPVSLQDTTVIDALIDAEEDHDALPAIELSPTVTRILDSPAIDDSRRQALQLFHGQWDEFTPKTPDQDAALAWGRYRLSDPSVIDESSDLILRAEVALFRGEAEEVLRLLKDEDSVAATYLQGRALEDLGRLNEAVALLTPLRKRFQHETLNDPAELTAGASAIVLLAHLEGRPSQDYQLALGMYGRAYQELDPLYWPARVAEAQLLMSKDNWTEASEALEEALSLNPKAGIAWYELGRLWVDSYNFDAAAE
ncbi:MAG: tetratricopeptide repeat protein, partial [Planctomycetota bacterium]